jgi:hypothetical protein
MACQNNQQCGSLNTSVTQCGQDESCSQQCLQQYPQGREPLLGVYQCLNSKCSSQCNG